MPEAVDDPVLGRLTWDAKLDWWVGAAEVTPGRTVEVFVCYEPSDARPDIRPDTVLAAARQNLARVREREADYRRWTAEQLLATRWNADEPMTVADIADLLKVASLTFWTDGAARIYWDDGDRLFWGNNLITDIGADGVCVSAGME